MLFRYLHMLTSRKRWASRWPWGRWYSLGTSTKSWTRSRATFDTQASHWNRSKPVLVTADLGFADTIFVGLELVWVATSRGTPPNYIEDNDANIFAKRMVVIAGAWPCVRPNRGAAVGFCSEHLRRWGSVGRSAPSTLANPATTGDTATRNPSLKDGIESQPTWHACTHNRCRSRATHSDTSRRESARTF